MRSINPLESVNTESRIKSQCWAREEDRLHCHITSTNVLRSTLDSVTVQGVRYGHSSMRG